MKRWIRLLSVLLLAAVLSGCSADFEPVGEEKVTRMMELLVLEDVEGAAAMMHPEALAQIEDPEGSLAALCQMLDGRTVVSCERESFEVYNQIGTKGASKRETGAFVLTLSDDTQVKADYIYLTDSAGEGFTSFYLHFEAAVQQTT